MKLNTPYRRPTRPEHTGFEPSKTEQTYIDTNQQLDRMMRAGERLKQARTDAFDFAAGEEDDDRTEPLRNLGIDMAEVSELADEARANMAGTSRRAKRKREADKAAKEAAQENPEDPEKDPINEVVGEEK